MATPPLPACMPPASHMPPDQAPVMMGITSPRTPRHLTAPIHAAGHAGFPGPVPMPSVAVKRQHDGSELDLSPSDSSSKGKRRRRGADDKGGKGLRHFSMKVCQKVEEKGVTSYLEVSDELVMEQQEAEERGEPSGEHGPKNIKRRVYDALNVLMAMNIISKEKKEIRWIGLPSNLNSECEQLEKLRAEKSAELARKTANLRELLLKHIAVKNLAKRNKAQRLINPNGEAEGGISLPFLVLNTSQKAVINCQMTEDKRDYFFDFNQPYEIVDDAEVLKRMGLAFGLDRGECSPADLQEAKTMVPKGLAHLLDDMAGKQFVPPMQALQPPPPLTPPSSHHDGMVSGGLLLDVFGGARANAE